MCLPTATALKNVTINLDGNTFRVVLPDDASRGCYIQANTLTYGCRPAADGTMTDAELLAVVQRARQVLERFEAELLAERDAAAKDEPALTVRSAANDDAADETPIPF